MNNPFKVGDKVVRRLEECNHSWAGEEGVVCTVIDVAPGGDIRLSYRPANASKLFDGWWMAERFRAAIAGQDYDVPSTAPNTGHLPDGSSVQKHSAGLLYPCVFILRDKRLHGRGEFDVGVISPRNPEPIWCSSTDAAVAVAVAIKADLQGA
jgi:hypothetical protein